MKVNRSTIQGIDFLRFLFSLLVLCAHSLEATKKYSARVFDEKLGDWTYWIAPGGFWVGGFFVLSGFCIALSVVRSLEKNTYSAGLYCVQRLTRIYPVYLIGLLLSVSVYVLLNPDSSFPLWSFVGNLCCVQGFLSEPFPYYDPSWSIAYEMSYYALVPLFMIKSGNNIKAFFWRAFLAMLAATLVFGGTWKFLLNEVGWMIPMWTVPWSGMLWLVGFSGVAFPQLRSLVSGWFPKRGLLMLGLFILTACYCYRTYALVNELSSLVRMIVGPLVGFGFLCVVFWLAESKVFSSVKLERFTLWGGLLSYPLYLFHMPLQFLFEALFLEDMRLNSSLYFSLQVALPLIVCGSIGVLLEKGFLSLRSQVLKSANLLRK